MNFYKDPRPERLVGFLDGYSTGSRNWDAYPPLAGFFGIVFRTHPDWIDKLAPARLDGKSAEALTAALRLSGQADKARNLRARLADASSDPKLKSELANLPVRPDDLRVATPTHLDILWGASFASGEGRYVRKIIDFFAQTANRSEPIALDVARTALAMMGGPKEVYGELRGKYGDALTREIAFAATALWALSSNARQHSFVDKAVAAYIEEHAGSHAAKALSAIRPRTNRT